MFITLIYDVPRFDDTTKLVDITSQYTNTRFDCVCNITTNQRHTLWFVLGITKAAPGNGCLLNILDRVQRLKQLQNHIH